MSHGPADELTFEICFFSTTLVERQCRLPQIDFWRSNGIAGGVPALSSEEPMLLPFPFGAEVPEGFTRSQTV
jgi:hypothetical protein